MGSSQSTNRVRRRNRPPTPAYGRAPTPNGPNLTVYYQMGSLCAICFRPLQYETHCTQLFPCGHLATCTRRRCLERYFGVNRDVSRPYERGRWTCHHQDCRALVRSWDRYYFGQPYY